MDKRQQVLNDIQLVLEKHGASITADDHWQGYPECGQDIRITIEIEGYEIEDIELSSCLDSNTDWKCLES